MCAAREATLGRDDVVAIVRIFQHHLFRGVEAYLAEPYPEVGVQALVKILAQLVFRYAKSTGKRQHIDIAILISQASAPLVKARPDKSLSLVRELP